MAWKFSVSYQSFHKMRFLPPIRRYIFLPTSEGAKEGPGQFSWKSRTDKAYGPPAPPHHHHKFWVGRAAQDALITGLFCLSASAILEVPEGFLGLCQGGNVITNWCLRRLNCLYIYQPFAHSLMYAYIECAYFSTGLCFYRVSLELGSENYSLLASGFFFFFVNNI